MRGEFMNIAETIKEFRDTLQSCRRLALLAREIRNATVAVGSGVKAHHKKHGSEHLGRASASLKRSATALVTLLDKEIASCEWNIKQTIAGDDSLKRTQHVDVSRRGRGDFRGRHASTAQQRLSGPWGEQ
jgi:hypothetical protein